MWDELRERLIDQFTAPELCEVLNMTGEELLEFLDDDFLYRRRHLLNDQMEYIQGGDDDDD